LRTWAYPRSIPVNVVPAKIYANEGLCQILFFQSDEVCEVSYADRKGKYQSQQGIVLPKMK
jgi:dCTP deaminase